MAQLSFTAQNRKSEAHSTTLSALARIRRGTVNLTDCVTRCPLTAAAPKFGIASDETTADLTFFHRRGLFTFDLSCPSLMHFAHSQQVEDKQNRIRYEQSPMTIRRDTNAQAAMQYLIWALENIEKAGNQKAAKHARIALEALREGTHRSGDKTDERAT
jgi:hypothetical protein